MSRCSSDASDFTLTESCIDESCNAMPNTPSKAAKSAPYKNDEITSSADPAHSLLMTTVAVSGNVAATVMARV